MTMVHFRFVISILAAVLGLACDGSASRMADMKPPASNSPPKPVYEAPNPGPDARYDLEFRVSGVVRDEAGRPIPDVLVTVHVDGTVFEVIEPLTALRGQTGSDGEFDLFALAHEIPDSYSLTFEKAGFKPRGLPALGYGSENHHEVTLETSSADP